MNRTYPILFLFISLSTFAQTLPHIRSVDWTLAGLKDTIGNGFVEIDMQEQGAVDDGTTPNDSIMANVFSTLTGNGAILKFPAGNFLFNKTINVPSNVIVKGNGAENTIFTMDLSGKNHSFNIQGYTVKSDTSTLIESASKDSSFVMLNNPATVAEGDWVKILQNDSDLVFSSWAEKNVGQIVQIKSIFNNKIILRSPLRMDYDIVRLPYLVKIIPAKNIGIECIKIIRIDDTAPEQTSNINFNYAVNCWVAGIESENCTFSHIQANHSSNLYISKSYFHDAFSYGGDGRAYGVMLQATSNECLVENNIFKHLRHSMILQSGANGNVFAYNYSLDPYWDSQPNDSAGDIVIHGNYTYANLFEQNICQNIVIDNSHGANGPYNSFFRNRAEGFGIFFSADNSPDQNIIGNEIPNNKFPYNLVNYTIQGTGHFIFGNNNKGNILPLGTNALPDTSYAYLQKPDFITNTQWAGIGTPNIMGATSIPAYDRYNAGNIFSKTCGKLTTAIKQQALPEVKILLFPNPMQAEMTVESTDSILKLSITNLLGQKILCLENVGFSTHINTSDWQNGVYFILINFNNNKHIEKAVVKSSAN